VSLLGPDQLTACQREVEKARRQETVDGPMMVGVYVPHCDEHGNYHPLQFHPSTGYHWCVDEHGREITGTSTPPSEPAPDCSQFNGSYNSLLSDKRDASMRSVGC